MEKRFIEINYDPAIKVRKVTEEHFNKQPENKFILKPFTIIGKKVFKKFSDRSLAFNYLLNFLKKKSKEERNFELYIFSEPKNLNRSFFSFFKAELKNNLKYGLIFFIEFLTIFFKYIPIIKLIFRKETTINNIMSITVKKKLQIIKIDIFIPLLFFLSPILFRFSSFYSFSIWFILFIIYFIVMFITFIKIKVNPREINTILEIQYKLKKLIRKIEKSKKYKNKKTVLIINFDIYSYYDSTTSLNLAKYLLNAVNENKNLNLIFHIQDHDYINFIKTELKENQFGLVNLLLESNDGIQELEFIDNDELKKENLPMKFFDYELHLRLEKLYEQNEELEKDNEELEKEKNEHLASLIQSAKLESMNITTSGVSHEIRNPLSIIQLVIENMRIEKNLNKEVLLKDLDKIQTQISRIYKLTETFQKFSTGKNLTKKSIDFQITNSLYFFEQRLLSNKILINYEKPKKQIGDIEFSEELSIVFENLISNSIDALKANKDATIRIKINLMDTELSIKFSDNGHGILEEDKKNIFTPLFTTKGPGQGTGLGLWLCHKIVNENLKGNITVDSLPSEWTTFTISLPVSGDENV